MTPRRSVRDGAQMLTRLLEGDCSASLRDLPDNSVDSVVTDPPYALVSIVKRFGKTSQADDTQTSDRSRKGSDGYARLAKGFMGKEWDNGSVAFAIEFWEQVLRVLKPGGHVAAFGGTRSYHRLACAIEDSGFEIRDQLAWCYGTGFPKSHNEGEGRGTALKPAWEPICLARKPLSEKTVAANILRWGTGALNIDGCRISLSDGDDPRLGGKGVWTTSQAQSGDTVSLPRGTVASSALGRWPANIVHDGSPEVVAAFPNQTARFFYSSKASAKDRAGSKHPTVKPISLMKWLCTLLTPPRGVVLDPFAGSGTTGAAAGEAGLNAILCEREPEYIADICRRLSLARTPESELAEMFS